MSVELQNRLACNVLTDQESILNAFKNCEVAITRADVVFSPTIMNWTPEYLAQNHGSVEVSTHAKFEGHDTFAHDLVSIKDFVPRLINARGKESEIEYAARASFYAAVNTRRILNRDLVGGLLASEHKYQFGHLWLGYSPGGLHHDDFNNILVQVHGKKRITVFPPHLNDQISDLHFIPLPDSYNLFCSQNVEKYPFLKNLPHYAIDLSPGDAVIIPSAAYHSANAYTVDSVSINTFFTPKRGSPNRYARKIKNLPWPVANAFIGLSRWSFTNFGVPLVKIGHYEIV